jgi:hypothetical protein
MPHPRLAILMPPAGRTCALELCRVWGWDRWMFSGVVRRSSAWPLAIACPMRAVLSSMRVSQRSQPYQRGSGCSASGLVSVLSTYPCLGQNKPPERRSKAWLQCGQYSVALRISHSSAPDRLLPISSLLLPTSLDCLSILAFFTHFQLCGFALWVLDTSFFGDEFTHEDFVGRSDMPSTFETHLK